MEKESKTAKNQPKLEGLPVSVISKWGLKNRKYILFAGALQKRQGVHFLIEVFKQLEDTAKMPNNFKLAIEGIGESDEDYVKYLRCISEGRRNIVLIRDKRGSTLKKLLAQAYLLVVPSSEAASLEIILAAMLGSLAVVVDSGQAHPSLTVDEDFLFKKDSMTELRDKLAFLLNRSDKVQAAGIRAKKRAEKFQAQIKKQKQAEHEKLLQIPSENHNKLSFLWKQLIKKMP